MIQRIAIVAAVFLLSCLSAVAQGGFAGSVTYVVSGAKVPEKVNFTMHGNGEKSRIDITMNQGQYSVITQGKDGPVLALLHQQKMAMEIDMSVAQSMMGSMGSGMPDVKTTVKKTGRKETIHGHECEVYEAATDGGTATLYCATDMGTFDGFGVAGPSFGDLQGQNTVPLKVVVVDASKATVLTMEATKISTAKPSADKFVLPPGYTLMPMGR